MVVGAGGDEHAPGRNQVLRPRGRRPRCHMVLRSHGGRTQ
jgi:hypothetical protein